MNTIVHRLFNQVMYLLNQLMEQLSLGTIKASQVVVLNEDM